MRQIAYEMARHLKQPNVDAMLARMTPVQFCEWMITLEIGKPQLTGSAAAAALQARYS